MSPPLGQSSSTLQKQAANLIHDGGASHHPTLAHTMHGLQVELFFRLDRHEPHPWPSHRFSDSFRIDIVALVRLHVRFDVLSRHQANLVPFPCSRKARPRKCAPLQASMPIISTCTFAVKTRTCRREQRLRITTWPFESRPTR